MNERPIADYLGRTLWDVLPPVAREELARDFRRVLEERVPVEERPVSTTEPGGRSRFFLASWFPVAVAERLIGVGLLLRDVTEQRRAEQSQRHLLGVVGHDLRSPLMAITASAELMQASPLDDRAARSVGRILRAAHRIDGIIRALVDYTLVQVGSGIPLHRRPTDLSAVVQAVAEEAEAAHPGRMVTVVAPAQVRGEWDPDRLGQALANLLGNALQYGQEDLAVRVVCRSDAGAGILEVTNDGPPIPGDLVPHLFEPFRRGNDDRSQRRKGLGLGLFIAQQIVHAHGGRIEVRSEAPAGTTFTVRIPAGAPPAPPAVTRDRDPGP
jgi:signal transduction histidine kinase